MIGFFPHVLVYPGMNELIVTIVLIVAIAIALIPPIMFFGLPASSHLDYPPSETQLCGPPTLQFIIIKPPTSTQQIAIVESLPPFSCHFAEEVYHHPTPIIMFLLTLPVLSLHPKYALPPSPYGRL